MNEITRIENPLEGAIATSPRGGVGAMANTDQQRAIAEVQAAMMIARANPRDEKYALDRILNACQRRGLAEVAVYSYSRGGSEITGPSIRLAEALAQNWGNIQFGIREVEQRGGESVVQAFAWDVETNVRREMTFTVPHLRHTRKGSYRLEDPRDIYEMVANNGARRLRSCILAVIPGDVIDTAVEQCELTMKVNADTSPEGIQKMVVAFQEYGVVQQQIEARIQRRLDSIQPAQVVALKKIYASLRDGMSGPADWFEPIDGGEPEKTKGNEAAKAALTAAKDKEVKKPAAKVEPKQELKQQAAEEEIVDPDTGEITKGNPFAQEGPADEQRGEAMTTGEEVENAIEAGETVQDEERPAWGDLVLRTKGGIRTAKNLTYLKSTMDEFERHIAVLPDEIVNEITLLANAKRKVLSAEKEG